MSDFTEHILKQVQLHYEKADYRSAKMQLEKIVAVDQNAEYFSALAIVEKHLKNYENSENYYSRAIKLAPNDYSLYYNLGNLYFVMKRYGESVWQFTKSIALKNDFHLAYANRGLVYRQMERFTEAVNDIQKALVLKPDFHEGYYNLGVIYELLEKNELAMDYYNKAISNNNDIYAHWNKSLLLLLNGDFKNGFVEYEWRKKRKEYIDPKFSRPSLLGRIAFGKKVLVCDEQGLGDTIHFFRYLKLLKETGCNVSYLCDKRLFGLLKYSDGFDQILPRAEKFEYKEDYDYHISLLSMPLYFHTEIHSVPNNVPYINVPSDKVEFWKSKINHEKKNVGIVWAGNSEHSNDKNRSINVKHFIGLTEISNCNFYSLQYEKRKGDEIILNHNIIDLIGEKKKGFDFSDTAAIIQNLDLIISVDTSVAHLSGALGKPIWNLIPYNPDWRWQKTGSASIWYPTMKLFRQEEKKNWKPVFDRLKDALKFEVDK